MIRILVVLLLVGLPSAVLGQSARDNATSAGVWQVLGTDSPTNSLVLGRTVFHEWTTGTVDSQMLNVVACQSIDIEFEPSMEDTDTVATTNVLRCMLNDADVDGTDDATSCDEITVDRDGDGLADLTTLNGSTATASRGFTNVRGANFIFADPQAAPLGSDRARVTVKCRPY